MSNNYVPGKIDKFKDRHGNVWYPETTTEGVWHGETTLDNVIDEINSDLSELHTELMNLGSLVISEVTSSTDVIVRGSNSNHTDINVEKEGYTPMMVSPSYNNQQSSIIENGVSVQPGFTSVRVFLTNIKTTDVTCRPRVLVLYHKNLT